MENELLRTPLERPRLLSPQAVAATEPTTGRVYGVRRVCVTLGQREHFRNVPTPSRTFELDRIAPTLIA